MTDSVFAAALDRIDRPAVAVMAQTTRDDLASIQKIWPSFEKLVGLRGRKMFALIDENDGTYTVCTPATDNDNAARFGLLPAVLPGGRYLRGRIAGDPPESFARIGTGMTELKAAAGSDADPGRPLVEFYRRHDQIELWVPLRAGSTPA